MQPMMFLGFSLRFTWVSLILHLICIIALAFLKFENVTILDDLPKEIAVTFDVISNNRNIKNQRKQEAIIPATKVIAKPSEKKLVVEKEVNKEKHKAVVAPIKKEVKSANAKSHDEKKLPIKSKKTPALVAKQQVEKPIEKYDDLFGLGEVIEDEPESIKSIEYIKGKIEEHRNFVGLYGKGLDEVEMVFEIGLNSDGSISFAEYLGDNAGASITENTRQALIRQNLRAIQLAAPFDKLEVSKHKNWQHVRLRFTQN